MKKRVGVSLLKLVLVEIVHAVTDVMWRLDALRKGYSRVKELVKLMECSVILWDFQFVQIQ